MKVKTYTENHPEQVFLLKAVLVIAAVLLLRNFVFLHARALFFPFLFAPVFYWMFLRIAGDETEKSSFRRFLESMTFIPAPVTENEWHKEGIAWGTYSLIFLNVFIYYILQQGFPHFVRSNLLFLPYDPTCLNLIISPFSSMFLHAHSGHLWGNMFFLWAIGTVVEKRVGFQNFILSYVAAGLISALGFINLTTWGMGGYPHLLGASGAISGVMGLYAVRCYFKTLLVPFPLLGVLSLFYPVYLKIRMNAFVVIGLFFALDLGRGINVVTGQTTSHIAYWAHIFGMISGVGLGLMLKLNHAATEEKYLEQGLRPWSAGYGTDHKSHDLQRVLAVNPEQVEARLELARIEAGREPPSEEGKRLYLEVVQQTIHHDPDKAAAAFREYLNRYWQRVDGPLQYRISQIYARQGDLSMAGRCLNMLVVDPTVDRKLREKAMYHEARLLADMGNVEDAKVYFEKMLNDFPGSSFESKVQAWIEKVP